MDRPTTENTLSRLELLYPAERRNVGDFDVEYIHTHGGGMPLLMLPGAQGNCEIFCRQLLRWGPTRTMVSLTYPESPDANVIVDWLDRFADAVGLETFDLLGSSLGGYLAQLYAARRPQRIRRLVIGNSFHDPTPSQAPERRAALEARSAEDVRTDAVERLRTQPEGPLKDVLLELVSRRQSAECLKARLLTVQTAGPLPALVFPPERILLVASDDDPVITPAVRQSMRTRHQGARETLIAGGGHYPYLAQPELYNGAVGLFLEM